MSPSPPKLTGALNPNVSMVFRANLRPQTSIRLLGSEFLPRHAASQSFPKPPFLKVSFKPDTNVFENRSFLATVQSFQTALSAESIRDASPYTSISHSTGDRVPGSIRAPPTFATALRHRKTTRTRRDSQTVPTNMQTIICTLVEAHAQTHTLQLQGGTRRHAEACAWTCPRQARRHRERRTPRPPPGSWLQAHSSTAQ